MRIHALNLSYIAVVTALISSPAFAGEELKGRAEVNFRYGQERSITMTEFWVPFMQDETSVLYGDIRMMGDNEDNREGNLGIGYRKIIKFAGFKGIAGTHSWIDRRKTARNSTFHQATLGAEWLSDSVDILANAYIPLSSERIIDVPNANPQAPALVGTGIVVDTDGKIIEEPQHGFDIELGWEFGRNFDFVRKNTDSLRLYGGGYYFNGDNTQSVAGWRTRLAADISPNVQVGARFQRDDERGSQGFLEATIRFPFGQKKSYRKEGLYGRLDESPERDIDIVTNETVIDTGDRVPVINAATGAVQEVLHVDNMAGGGGDGSVEAPFNTLAAAEGASSAQTIIYVNRGDGTTAGQNAGIALDKTGQQLIGSGTNFIYDGGRFTTANGASPSAIIIRAASTAPVITNAGGNGVDVTADNITVAGVTIDGASADGIMVEADGGAASALNVSIKDVTAQNNRFGIYVHGANGGSVSASVQGSVTTANSQHGVAIYDDTSGIFDADLGGGSMGSTGNNVLAGNTLEDLAVELDGGTLQAQNNWWGQATGADTDTPDIGIAPQIYYGAPINNGLVGHWTFDNEWLTNTTAYDRSGQGNDGALEGGLSLADSVTGQNRQALYINDVSHLIRVPDDNSLDFGIGDFTVISNYSPDTFGDSRFLLTKGAGAGLSGFRFGSSNDEVSYLLGDAASFHSVNISAGVITTGTYQNIGIVYDRDNAAIGYYNGAFAGQSGNITLDAGSIDTGNNLLIRPTLGGRPSIKIDDIAIYNRAFTAAEIAELHRADTSSAVNTANFLTAVP